MDTAGLQKLSIIPATFKGIPFVDSGTLSEQYEESQESLQETRLV